MTKVFNIGDEVMYSAKWLRSVGAYTGPLPFARGKVTKVEPATAKWYSDGVERTLVTWVDQDGDEYRVLNVNLILTCEAEER